MHHAGYVMVEWCVPAVDIPSGSRTDIFERQASMAHFLPPALFSPSHNHGKGSECCNRQKEQKKKLQLHSPVRRLDDGSAAVKHVLGQVQQRQ